MTRLLFLCLLLLLPASADISDTEGSADNPDDEDENADYVSTVTSGNRLYNRPDSEKATGGDENGDGYLIIIVIAGVVLALSVAAVVTILIVRRKMQQQEQGIYTVPTEQDHKEKV